MIGPSPPEGLPAERRGSKVSPLQGSRAKVANVRVCINYVGKAASELEMLVGIPNDIANEPQVHGIHA